MGCVVENSIMQAALLAASQHPAAAAVSTADSSTSSVDSSSGVIADSGGLHGGGSDGRGNGSCKYAAAGAHEGGTRLMWPASIKEMTLPRYGGGSVGTQPVADRALGLKGAAEATGAAAAAESGLARLVLQVGVQSEFASQDLKCWA